MVNENIIKLGLGRCKNILPVVFFIFKIFGWKQSVGVLCL